MRNGTHTMLIGMMAPITFSLAATTTVEAATTPPKYQGEWCHVKKTHFGNTFDLCKDRKEGSAGIMRVVIDENAMTVIYSKGTKLVCKAKDQVPKKDGHAWAVNYDCEGSLQTFMFNRLYRPPELDVEDFHNSQIHEDFVKSTQHARQVKRQMEDIYSEPKP